MDWFLYDSGLRHERVNSMLPTEHAEAAVRIFSSK